MELHFYSDVSGLECLFRLVNEAAELKGFHMPAAADASAHKPDELLKLASDIIAAYVSNNPVPVSELPSMIKNVHSTLGGLANGGASESLTSQKPAVPIKKSITPE